MLTEKTLEHSGSCGLRHSSGSGKPSASQQLSTARCLRKHKGRIWGVYLKKELRGKGMGGALLAEVMRVARCQPGLEQVVLTVAAGQAAAKKLYSSLGFEVYGRELRALKVDDSYVDEELMVLRLGRA